MDIWPIMANNDVRSSPDSPSRKHHFVALWYSLTRKEAGIILTCMFVCIVTSTEYVVSKQINKQCEICVPQT